MDFFLLPPLFMFELLDNYIKSGYPKMNLDTGMLSQYGIVYGCELRLDDSIGGGRGAKRLIQSERRRCFGGSSSHH